MSEAIDYAAVCDACGFVGPVGGVRDYPVGSVSAGKNARLCQICANTFAGREATGMATDNGPLLLSVAWIGNRIRRDLAER